MAASSSSVPFSVSGKTAIITGAGSGINLSFAQLLLSRNCNVVIADLSLRPEAQKLVDEHSSQDDGKARAMFTKTDVTLWEDLEQMFEVAEKEFGGTDVVCPGAGVYEPHWSNFWHPPGTARSKDSPHGSSGLGHYATLDINLTHPIRTTQIAISKWLNPPTDSRVGKASPTSPKRVVHISSIAGQLPGFGTPLYQASKHAISGFIRCLANLDTIGIRVNGVAPGLIKTPLWTEHPEKLQVIDEERDSWVMPEEVAEVMLRCVEDDAIGGGFVMEVLKGTSRNVQALNDPGPSGPGSAASNAAVSHKEVLDWLSEPGWGVSS